ncbi:glycosyltransferase [Swaminathania salitolerans]|uniref:Glycosyl transferase n=1 Tax=Swaminathania salitolerans TaxID=182838 RepID=A0A511BN35_9PROT|nr:glycosyltransferase [Swaminathania salitolerans]GBQ13725.1 glycosyltransferase [Swaminathania salitolerans LMG 21291]GEL01757.1 glycosyl transferase [Swaminathania salitolerans]
MRRPETGPVQRGLERSALALAILPCIVALANLRALGKLPAKPGNHAAPRVSVLIPARNEAGQIVDVLRNVLEDSACVAEIIVLDDHSDDGTAARARTIADPRLRIVAGADLPEGWCGKTHACAQLADHANGSFFLFLDADVRLERGAIARLTAGANASGKPDMISGVPRQITKSILEWMLLPFIDLLIQGYLPLPFDRGTQPALAAACGQLVFVRADAYRRAGGHAAIRSRLHDGLALARHMRQAGFRTAIIDASDIATCRMYRNAREVYAGLMKNAVEGLAGPVSLPVWTVILGGGHVLPFLCRSSRSIRLARFASLGVRLLIALRSRQSLKGIVFHPLGVALLLVIQYHARLRHILKRPVSWRGRHYDT